jgi:hypothetical protein
MGLVANGLSAPTGLALDGSSSVYVIQSGAPGTVLKEVASGNGYSATTVAGGGNFNGVAVDAKKNVFLTAGDGSIYEYSPRISIALSIAMSLWLSALPFLPVLRRIRMETYSL